MTADEVMALIRASDKPFYCYVLQRPCGEPIYIGIGTKRRILDHEIFARRPILKSHKLAVIRKIWRSGRQVEYQIVDWFEDRPAAEAAERQWIATMGRRDLGDGPLTNITDGGEGAPAPSEDVRKARSERCKAAWDRRKSSGETCDHLHTPEVKAKARRAREARSESGPPRKPAIFTQKPGRQSQESRRALSEQLKADPVSRRPGVGAKISAALRGRKNPRASRMVVIDGVSFGSIREAASAFGVDRGTIIRWEKNPGAPRGRWPKQK